VQLVGDSAIERASARNGDLKAAMWHILEKLPEPKLVWLKALAIAVVKDHSRTRLAMSRYLGISYRSATHQEKGDWWHKAKMIDDIIDETRGLAIAADGGGT
jgi:hypothetical protein